MPQLLNSSRISYKATYVPSMIPREEQEQAGRAAEKLALLRGLAVSPAELEQLREAAQAPTEPSGLVAVDGPLLLDLAARAAADPSPGALRRLGPQLAAVPAGQLAAFGRAVAGLRTGDAAAQAIAQADALTYHGVHSPVGWLHLERLEMIPVGIEHGELVHSVPLTPTETVNITHREWTVTSQTFEELISDSLEGFSEVGVTEKTDLTQATDTQAKHSSALDVNGNVTASYNGGAYSVTASAGVDYKNQTDIAQSIKDSVAHSTAITKQASSRTRKEHKQSFRVSSVSGAEDLAVRVLHNPSDTKAMRVDYYQLIRRWQVDLIRYGLRMTYDLVVPNPGLDLILRVLELRKLEATINNPFSFGVNLNEVKPDTYEALAATYGAEVEKPPPDTLYQVMHKEFKVDKDPSHEAIYDAFEFEVDPDYQVNTANFTCDIQSIHTSASQHDLAVVGAGSIYNTRQIYVAQLNGLYGKLDVQYWYVGLSAFSTQLEIITTVRDEAMNAWQLKAWNQLRQAAYDAYQRDLQRLKDQRDALAAEIGGFNALTLRKMEHEEIMKAVLTWLIGPAFKLTPDPTLFTGYPDASNPLEQAYKPVDQLTVAEWTQVVGDRGELIKFLHNAIEWENVLFFVYPYFWDHAANWPFKRFLVHPDPVHRDFLRSGSARVVLTVRPGFEVAFATFLDTGDPERPPPVATPYVTIAEETRNFAMTNYENIPPANPDHNVRELLQPEQRAAWADIQAIMRKLEAFNTVNGRYPTTAEGLAALPQPVPQQDPWNHPYHYSSPGLHNDYDLASYGKSGKAGEPDNITSWAEGSVVGRWYEYTPTSALDVSIADVLPKPEPA